MKSLTHTFARLLKRACGGRPAVSADDYKSRFPESAEAFRVFLSKCEIPDSRDPDEAIGVVVMPWVGTSTPWFDIAIAINLAQRGLKPILIWNDIPFPARSDFFDLQNKAIEKTLRQLAGRLKIIRLSESPTGPCGKAEVQQLRDLAALNVSWSSRASTESGELAVVDMQGRSSRDAVQQIYFRSIKETFTRVDALLNKVRFRYLVCPGGIYAASGAFLLAARRAGVRATTHDGGNGWIRTCSDGVAAQQADLPSAFASLWNSDADQRAHALNAARTFFENRSAGRDKTQYQVAKSGGVGRSIACDILLPMNVDWDAAALGKHRAFADTVDWITSVVEFVLEKSTASIVVRQHPSERHDVERSRLDINTILTERFGDHSRLRFVPAEEAVSTYDLLASATLVLPFVSTIGMEAAAIGKPVLVAGASCYSELGFVWSASSRSEYFDLLSRGIAHQLPRLTDQCEKAWICYYLSAICNFAWTDFTPQPPDFWKWVKRDPRALFAEPGVDQLLTTITTNTPLSLVVHAAHRKESKALLAASS